jgi:hypothetical protein
MMGNKGVGLGFLFFERERIFKKRRVVETLSVGSCPDRRFEKPCMGFFFFYCQLCSHEVTP